MSERRDGSDVHKVNNGTVPTFTGLGEAYERFDNQGHHVP